MCQKCDEGGNMSDCDGLKDKFICSNCEKLLSNEHQSVSIKFTCKECAITLMED